MRSEAEKANKYGAAQARRERRLQVFAEKDPRLQTAKKPKLHIKNRDALAIRFAYKIVRGDGKFWAGSIQRGKRCIRLALVNNIALL